ncbi:MAG: hypothetical protein WD276_06695 [Actinomycetota bacterium]
MLKLQFDGWQKETKYSRTRARFTLLREEGGEPLDVFLSVPDSVRDEIQIPPEVPAEKAERRLEDALLRYAVARFTQAILDGLLPSSEHSLYEDVKLEEADLPAIIAMMAEKNCSYQRHEGRDILCSAAVPDDPTAKGVVGVAVIAPTSPALCMSCELPDTDFVCSHFLDPRVTGDSGPDGRNRNLLDGVCELGRSEIDHDPGGCRAGGHSCWEYVIQPPAPAKVAPLPLALPEEIDFLETSWRLAFRASLVRIPEVSAAAELSKPCSSVEEFEARVVAMASLLDALDVPGDESASDHPLDRMLSLLKERLKEDDFGPVQAALVDLEGIVQLSEALQNKMMKGKLQRALSRLRVPYPTGDWGETWDRIRSLSASAVTVIRKAVRGLEPGPPPEEDEPEEEQEQPRFELPQEIW